LSSLKDLLAFPCWWKETWTYRVVHSTESRRNSKDCWTREQCAYRESPIHQ